MGLRDPCARPGGSPPAPPPQLRPSVLAQVSCPRLEGKMEWGWVASSETLRRRSGARRVGGPPRPGCPRRRWAVVEERSGHRVPTPACPPRRPCFVSRWFLCANVRGEHRQRRRGKAGVAFSSGLRGTAARPVV